MSRALLSLFALFTLFACSDPDPRTQITFVLEASPELTSRVASLNVTVSSERRTTNMTFTRGQLRFPVEIVVIPEGANRTTRVVRLMATAVDDAQRAIASWDRSEAFLPRENLFRRVPASVIPVDPGQPMGDGGAEPAGPDGGLDGGATEPRDGEVMPDEAATTDATTPEAATPDAAPGMENCLTPGTTIRCDDDNLCDGIERCEPTNAAADELGCVAGTPVACTGGTTCDRATGMCSTCGDTPDGDNDGVPSQSCGGTDCDDNDDTIAPGKPERCDRKDNDCNDVVDDPSSASADCTAPAGGTASCVEGRCTQRCNDPNHQIENGACVPPVGTCPIVNPCAPGRCVPERGGYTCECPSGYRAGLARCAPSGVKERTIGFEAGCDGMPTPGAFVMGSKLVPSNLYASCGVSALSSSGLMAQAQLFEPAAPMAIEGMTGTVVLAGTSGPMDAPSEIVISFSPGVHELALDALDLEAPTGLRVRLEAADGMALLDAPVSPAAGSKRVRVMQTSMTPIARAVLSYAPIAADDAWYVDALTFDVWGCGDGELDMSAGETCDDGNVAQCDGCDNACAASPMMCVEPGPTMPARAAP